MRAPIEPGNPGWDPDAASDRGAKVGAAIRGAGFLAIVIAFLFVSQSFVGNDEEPATSPSGNATVYVDQELERVVSELESPAIVEYGASAALREKIAADSIADVFVGTRADAQSLTDQGLCSEPALITTTPVDYAGCLVTRKDARTDAGTQFLKVLTGIQARNALLEAGYDLPPR